jgi:hypothetical protein
MADGLVSARELAGTETPRRFAAPDARKGAMEVAHAGLLGRPGRKLRRLGLRPAVSGGSR